MKKGYLTTIIAVPLIIVLAVIIMLITGSNGEDDTLRTVPVNRRDISASILATGIIKPKVGAEVRVGSRVSGIVKKLHANIGDMVDKGQIVAELDPTELQAKYNQAEAALANARASLNYARMDLKRQKSLLEQDFISENQYNIAEKSFEINKAQVEQASANLEHARVQLGYTRITSPIKGVVASVSTQEGETVAANFSAPTFVKIIDLTRLEIQAYVDETDIGRVRVGQRASFTVDTYMGTDFDGTVTAIYPKAVIQDNVVNYIATVDIVDFRGKRLRPEMTTTVNVYLNTRENVLTVPTRSLRRERGGMAVTVIENDQPVSRRVETGWSSGGYTEIKEGLNENDQVVIE